MTSHRMRVLLSAALGALLTISLTGSLTILLGAPSATATTTSTTTGTTTFSAGTTTFSAGTTTGTVPTVAARRGPSKRAVRWERKIVRFTNARREAHGCREVKVKRSLRKAARRHTRRMARQRTLSHRLPGEAGMARRIERAGYRHWRVLAENIAVGQSSPRRVVRAWMHSSTHRRNILDCRFRHIGVGVRFTHGRPWITQDFGRR